MTILVIVVFLTIFISAHCSLFEAVLYSTRIGTLEVAATRDNQSKAAKKFINMKKSIAEPLSSGTDSQYSRQYGRRCSCGLLCEPSAWLWPHALVFSFDDSRHTFYGRDCSEDPWSGLLEELVAGRRLAGPLANNNNVSCCRIGKVVHEYSHQGS